MAPGEYDADVALATLFQDELSKLDSHWYVIAPMPPDAAADEVKVAGVAPTQIVWEAEIDPAVNTGFTVMVVEAVAEQLDVGSVPVTV